MLDLSTPELRAGDVVHCHGMRCLIDREPRLSRSHPGGRTFYTDALVLNRDEVSADSVPLSFTACGDGPHRWVIQGNDLARWAVTRS